MCPPPFKTVAVLQEEDEAGSFCVGGADSAEGEIAPGRLPAIHVPAGIVLRTTHLLKTTSIELVMRTGGARIFSKSNDWWLKRKALAKPFDMIRLQTCTGRSGNRHKRRRLWFKGVFWSCTNAALSIE